MVSQFQGQAAPRIRDLYFGVLDAIMNEHHVEPLLFRPSLIVSAHASFPEVVQHTDWWLRRNDRIPHYRYNRYRATCGDPQPTGDRRYRLAHVDVGCGAGLWSWVLLDWAADANLAYNLIDLYGIDHSPAMITLANFMRDGFVATVANYPELHYETNVQMLLQALIENHQEPTDYMITFGHVLVQALAESTGPDAISAMLNFTSVIVHILRSQDRQSNCVLAAIDARGRSNEFSWGWQALLSNLALAGVRYENIVDANDAKVARLSLAH